MPSKSILIYKLTPVQIELVERLAPIEPGVPMDCLGYPELIAYQELEKLGFAAMSAERRKKIRVVLTDHGRQVRAAGYISKKPVIRLTVPQIIALRSLAAGPQRYNDIPGSMKDTYRRMALRGWAATDEDGRGQFWMRLTRDGREIVDLVDF